MASSGGLTQLCSRNDCVGVDGFTWSTCEAKKGDCYRSADGGGDDCCNEGKAGGTEFTATGCPASEDAKDGESGKDRSDRIAAAGCEESAQCYCAEGDAAEE